jgi:hypothetical protein
MDLADLKTSVSNLSDEELMKTLMGIRANRRVSKAQPTQKKSSSPSKPASIESLLASASPDMIAQMIEALEKGKA